MCGFGLSGSGSPRRLPDECAVGRDHRASLPRGWRIAALTFRVRVRVRMRVRWEPQWSRAAVAAISFCTFIRPSVLRFRARFGSPLT